MDAQHHTIRRRADGSIDIDFYCEQGLMQRRQAMNGFFRGIGQGGRRLLAAILAGGRRPRRAGGEIAELGQAVAPSMACLTVIALHCSGADGSQWRRLGEALAPDHELITPDHYGCARIGQWPGDRAFTLADEAEQTIALIDRAGRPVHLVGHSYGGAVALHVALARPDRIASLSLYEPCPFHLLKQLGARGAAACAEITALAETAGSGVARGDYGGAVSAFVDYWGGFGTWQALRPALRDDLVRWAPKLPLEFAAVLRDATPASAYRRLAMPVLILRGEHAPEPTRLIAGMLAPLLPRAHLAVIAGAGHMGPLTHAAEVNRLILQHVTGSVGEAEHAMAANSNGRLRSLVLS
jgi:pimeloyl-ACP methyl ester carboxylesterase